MKAARAELQRQRWGKAEKGGLPPSLDMAAAKAVAAADDAAVQVADEVVTGAA